MKYGCIGEKLGHSFSKEIHERLADYTYELKELTPEELSAFMQEEPFAAINVTIPYKQAVIPYLREISPQARAIGAVNTIVRREGKLWGYNTDFWGLRALIQRIGVPLSGKKVLILGSGGTSRAARAVAADLGAGEILIVSRNGRDGISYETARIAHKDASFIINTTPCGMFPQIDGIPVNLDDYPQLEGVADAVYNPLRTRLVSRAREKGIPAEGGLYMLVAQAAYAVEHFLDTVVAETKIEEVFRALTAEKENIVLTGMPGAGKTTVGRLLAARLGRPFWDTDQLITERAGRTPAEIIAEDGEPAFRDLEAAVIREQIAPLTGAVIATGGGAILRDENITSLRFNGRIYFLDRPLEDLVVTNDRPLSGSRALLEQRYKERYARYLETADRVITAPSSPKDACGKIAKDFTV